MPRFYLPKNRWNTSIWELDGDEAKHAAKVLRLKEGDACTVFDGEGRASRAIIAAPPSSSSVLLKPDGECSAVPGIASLTLCQSIPKGSNMDLIIQKSVELGVGRIIPLITEHTIVRLTPKDAETKQAKWQRTALEACKQCGQNTLPSVEPPRSFREWLNETKLPEVPIIASLAPGALPIRNVLEEARSKGCRSAAVLVGPEGDFTAGETTLALDAGFRPVTLGPIVLRVETATFFCLSAMRYALD